MNRAIFLDRDGTLNYDIDRVHHFRDFQWLPNAINGLKILKEHGYLLIVVTNQAGVARGIYSENDVIKLHEAIDKDLMRKAHFKIDKWYYCPHYPEGSVEKYRIGCECRKPKSGLLRQAISFFNLDPKYCWLIGDKISDITAGRDLNINSILLMTGFGKEEFGKLGEKSRKNLTVAMDLSEASRFIIEHE